MAKRVDQKQKIDERTGVQDGKVRHGNETHKKDLTRMRGQIAKKIDSMQENLECSKKTVKIDRKMI